MSISVGDVLKVVAIMSTLDGNIFENVFSAVISGSGGPFDDDDIVDDAVDWLDQMYANITDRVSNLVDGSEARIYVYDPVDEDYDEVGSGAWGWNPTSAIEPAAWGVAGLINAKTTDPDVSGKKYVPGLHQQNIVDALFISAWVTALGNFAADWVTPFTGATSGADWVPGVWSPTRSNFYAASGTVLIPTIPSYQRRRKQGVGI